VGSLPKAIEIYNEILERTKRGEQPQLLNNYIFGTMLNVCNMANNLAKAEEVFADIAKQGGSADIVAYGTIINLCTNLKEKDIALKYYSMMKQKNVEPNAYIITSMHKVDPEAFPENRTVSGRRPLSASARSPRDRLTSTWGGSEGINPGSLGELRRMRSYENVKRGSYETSDMGFSRNRSFEHVRSGVESLPTRPPASDPRPLSASTNDNWRRQSQGGERPNREKLSQSERQPNRGSRTQSEKSGRNLQGSQRKMGDSKRGTKPKLNNSTRSNLKGSSSARSGSQGQVWTRKPAVSETPSDESKNTGPEIV
jgi:pentatricopeptide repeat protein